MKHEVFRCLGVLAGLLLAGCAATTGPAPVGSADTDASPPASPPPAAPEASLPGPPTPAEQSIYRIRQPGSRVVAGTRVVLGGPTIQVTAVSSSHVWIQEAGGDGRCEVGDDAVAYRAIVVTPSGAVPPLARGQRVEVEGVVTDAEGHRTLTEASLRAVGAPGEPYVPHCRRDAAALATDALDGVLVVTAGSTASMDPPTSDGAWSLATCFGTSSPSIVIGAEMSANSEWAPTWYWVTGVLTRRASVVRLEPRNAEDIAGPRSNDVCL